MTTLGRPHINTPRNIAVQDHVRAYIGEYVDSADFKLAEFARCMDMSIRDLIADESSRTKADDLRYAGWGQLFSMALVVGPLYERFGASPNFSSKVESCINDALKFVRDIPNPMADNRAITRFTKPALMNPTHPTHPSDYLPWKPLEGERISAVLEQLTQITNDAYPSLEIVKGSVLLMMKTRTSSSIFDEIWTDKFKQDMTDLGFPKLGKPFIEPHMTLINAEQVEKLRNGLGDSWLEKTNSLIEATNKKLQSSENILNFNGIRYTFSTEFSTYTDVIVATVDSDVVDSAMQDLKNQVLSLHSLEISTKPVASFHLTLGGTPRAPWPLDRNFGMDAIISSCGKYSRGLAQIWQTFLDSQKSAS